MAIQRSRLINGYLGFGMTGQPNAIDFSPGTTAITINPSTSEGETIRVLSGASDVINSDWEGTMEIEFYQVYERDALIKWTWDNNGRTVPFVFQPTNNSTWHLQGEVIVSAAPIGGEVNTDNTSSIDFKIHNRPRIIDGTVPSNVRIKSTSSTTTTNTAKS